MDINDFIANISSQGIAKASTYEVIVTRPGGNGDMQMFKYRADGIDWPGRNITTTDSNYTGVPYKIGTAVTYNDINMSVILSEDFREKIYIEEWQDMIVGKHRKEESGNMFNLSFYDDYIGTVEILQYNEIDELVYSVKLIDAYPTTLGSMTSSWASSAEILKLPVSFTFRYYKDKKEV